MSNAQMTGEVRLSYGPARVAAPKVPESLARSVEVPCSRCRRAIGVTVTTTHRVEERKGRLIIRGRHTAPARVACPQCATAFRLHLIEQPDGQVIVSLGVKLAS